MCNGAPIFSDTTISGFIENLINILMIPYGHAIAQCHNGFAAIPFVWHLDTLMTNGAKMFRESIYRASRTHIAHTHPLATLLKLLLLART